MKPSKKKKTCETISPQQTEALVRSIILQAENDERRSATHKKRITAPSGAVMLF